MNLPNKLTLIRITLIPAFILFAVYDFFAGDNGAADWISRIIASVIFITAAVTDFLDGHIARKRQLITDFGKFMDPLADKFLVLGAMFSLCMSPYAIHYNDWFVYDFCIPENVLKQMFFWCSMIVLFRELAVTSMRLVVAKSGVVVAANILGKIKTNTQIICICSVLLEPLVLPFARGWFTFIMIILVSVFTVWSGLNYILTYWKYLDATK
ncbi:MAG: CDP-alcohol phosphatidyltransferase family protein [Clostridiales bacterium]|nr:CDP-alcohol phosphatidyltransferase family protein [Candidatus Coliplasma caballi]